jgi:hypothetical protein
MSLGIAVRERQTTASKTLGCLIVKLRLEGEGRVIFEATDNLPFFLTIFATCLIVAV